MKVNARSYAGTWTRHADFPFHTLHNPHISHISCQLKKKIERMLPSFDVKGLQNFSFSFFYFFENWNGVLLLTIQLYTASAISKIFNRVVIVPDLVQSLGPQAHVQQENKSTFFKKKRLKVLESIPTKIRQFTLNNISFSLGILICLWTLRVFLPPD